MTRHFYAHYQEQGRQSGCHQDRRSDVLRYQETYWHTKTPAAKRYSLASLHQNRALPSVFLKTEKKRKLVILDSVYPGSIHGGGGNRRQLEGILF